MEGLVLCVGDDNEVDVSQGVPFNGEGFDVSLDLTGPEKSVLLFANGYAVVEMEYPACFKVKLWYFIRFRKDGGRTFRPILGTSSDLQRRDWYAFSIRWAISWIAWEPSSFQWE